MESPSISYSRRDALRRCPRKYFLQYVKGIKPIETAAPLRMGAAFSDALEQWDLAAIDAAYADPLMQAGNTEAMMVEKVKVEVMAEAYMDKYPQPDQREVPFERDVLGWNDNGRFDGVNDDGLTLIEDKLKGRWSPADAASVQTLDEQATAYLVNASILFDEPIENLQMLYRATIKPLHKYNNSKETIGEYKARVAAAVAENPKRYLNEVVVTRTSHQAAEWQRELEETIEYIEWLAERGTWRRHTHACGDFGGCDLLEICTAANEDEVKLALQGFTTKERS